MSEAPKILCHAEGDRCYGCAHYHGKAPVCEYADREDGRIPWLPEELVDDLRIAVYEDFSDPFDRLAAMTLAAEHIFDAINALEQVK